MNPSEIPNHPFILPFEPNWLEFRMPEPFLPAEPHVRPEELLQRIDLTTLQGDDCDARIEKLCETAIKPVHHRPELKVAAVCAFPVFVPSVLEHLLGTGIQTATVAAAFPHGLAPFPTRLAEIQTCAELGADEIDIVIRRSLANDRDWIGLYNEVVQFRIAAGDRKLKVILATGELQSPSIVYCASMVSLLAGADFIKTSTGKEAINATIEAGTIMVAALRSFAEKSGRLAGIKAAGGIKTYNQADSWYQLVYQRLGNEAIHPTRFRIGASSLVEELATKIVI